MKKFLVVLTTICMISLVAVSAFAYDAVDGKGWVTGISVDTQAKTATVKVSDKFLEEYATHGYRIAVFSEEPTLPTEDDEGFWVIYNGADNTDRQGKGTLVYGVNMVSGATHMIDASGFTEGKMYYLTLTGNNQSYTPPGDWFWTTTTFSFEYTTGEYGTEPGTETADLSVVVYAIAAITGCGALLIAKRK